MSLATSNRDGGRTNEAGHLRGVTKGFLGRVLSGLNVSQRGAGANMSVDVAIGDAIIQRSDGTYGHPAWNDAVYNQAIAAADGSNPRRDIVVMYIDYNETPSTGVANNTNGVVKITSVSGTAAGSPVDPSNATIQSAVGSGNPFIKLARVRVAAGATSISNSVIDDLRELATGMSQGGWIYDSVYTWVYGSASTFTIAGVDVTAQFPVGTKLRIMQSGSVKYFTVTAASFSTNTTITVDGGASYTLANAPIDIPAFSYDEIPVGYPSTSISDPLGGWKLLARVQSTASTVMTANLTKGMRYLKVLVSNQYDANSRGIDLRFNNDSGNNYSHNRVLLATNTDNGANNSLEVNPNYRGGFSEVNILNVNGQVKQIFTNNANYRTGTASTAADIPTISIYGGKWTGTALITRIDAIRRVDNFVSGAELIVLGRD